LIVIHFRIIHILVSLTCLKIYHIILWHVDLLLGNER
jgi:hypothetical protein